MECAEHTMTRASDPQVVACRFSKVSEEDFPLLTDLPGSTYHQVQSHWVPVLQGYSMDCNLVLIWGFPTLLINRYTSPRAASSPTDPYKEQ